MSASRGNDANGGHACGASAAHDRAWENDRADLDSAAIAGALNGSQP
jgi:hypothetical protein